MVGNLNSKISRSMYNLAYYSFLLKLVGKEYYTTKTCGNYGTLNHSIGRNKLFECQSCGIKMDRDHNGGRNALLRNLKYA